MLGGGSNVLVSDAGFDGLVLHVALRGIADGDCAGQHGSDLSAWRAEKTGTHSCERTVEDELCGFECLAGIPGTVGGTPVQNVGAYGQEVASVIERVRVFDLEDASLRRVSPRRVRLWLSPQPLQL